MDSEKKRIEQLGGEVHTEALRWNSRTTHELDIV